MTKIKEIPGWEEHGPKHYVHEDDCPRSWKVGYICTCYARQHNSCLADIEGLAVTMDRNQLLGYIAQGWCQPKTSSKEMDSILANAIADSIISAQAKILRIGK